MQIQSIEGATRTLGASQGYNALPIRDITVDAGDDKIVPAMVSAWRPNPEELVALNQGKHIHLTILGKGHPPVMLTVAP